MNILFCIILAFISGIIAGYLLLKRRIYGEFTQLSFIDQKLSKVFNEILKQIEIDQAYIFLIKEGKFRSSAWAKNDTIYWEKIKLFEEEILNAIHDGLISNPHVKPEMTNIDDHKN